MHELSLAQSLVDQVEEILDRENASSVAVVSVRIGALSGVDRDAFEFAAPVAFEGTRLDGAKLEIEETPAVVRCSSCGKESNVDIFLVRCGHCESMDVEIVSGREFLMTSIDVR